MISTAHTLDNYERSILDDLSGVTKPWVKIAATLAEAKSRLSKDDFRSLKARIRFSEGTISKLLAITESVRLERYKDQLAHVDAYTTLYLIEKLDPQEFKNFEDEYLSGDQPKVILRGDVLRFKKSVSRTPTSARPVVVIKLDPSHATASELDALEEALEILMGHNVPYETTQLLKELRNRIGASSQGSSTELKGVPQMRSTKPIAFAA